MSHIVMPAIGALWALLLFGAGVAPSFLLVGWPLYRAVRHLGWTGPLVGGLTLAGTGLVVVSYLAVDWREPWGWLWGIEGPVLAAIGLASAGAGVTAWRRGAPRRWATMLIALPAVIVLSTILMRYYPHGTLVGLGFHVVALNVVRRPGRTDDLGPRFGRQAEPLGV